MAVLCGMQQYSIRLEAVRYLCTSCLLPSFDNAWCHVPVTERCQRYLPCYLFSVSSSVCFSSILSARQHSGLRGLPNIGQKDVAENLGMHLPCRKILDGKSLQSEGMIVELILTVKNGN